MTSRVHFTLNRESGRGMSFSEFIEGLSFLGLRSGFREKAMKPKLAENALNRLQNHTKDKETHKQN